VLGFGHNEPMFNYNRADKKVIIILRIYGIRDFPNSVSEYSTFGGTCV
jgi:hypothetical protein